MNRTEADEIAECWRKPAFSACDEASLAKAFCERCVDGGPAARQGLHHDRYAAPAARIAAFFWDEDPTIHPREEELGFEPRRRGPGGLADQPVLPSHPAARDGSALQDREGETRGYKALEELRNLGQTDYLAIVYRIRHASRVEDVDGFYARFTTARPGGFSDVEIAHLTAWRRCSALPSAPPARRGSRARWSRPISPRPRRRRVLNGGFRRGAVEKINAVLWFSDMTGSRGSRRRWRRTS